MAGRSFESFGVDLGEIGDYGDAESLHPARHDASRLARRLLYVRTSYSANFEPAFVLPERTSSARTDDRKTPTRLSRKVLP